MGQWYRIAATDLDNTTSEQLVKVDGAEGDRLFIDQSGKMLVTGHMHNSHKFGARASTPKYYTQSGCPFPLSETRVYKDVAYDGDPARNPARGWSDESKVRATMTVTVAPAFESNVVGVCPMKARSVITSAWGKPALSAKPASR